jgi:enoyl-CoA hydratase
LACDLRVAVDTARLGVPASRFGLLPGPVHHRRMIQQLGPQVTRELMLTGRSFTGEEAVRRGLVDYCFSRQELDAGLDALCDDIIAGAPITVRNSKRMTTGCWSWTHPVPSWMRPARRSLMACRLRQTAPKTSARA